MLGLVTLGIAISSIEMDWPDLESWETFQESERQRLKKIREKGKGVFIPA